jgi:hypothetical protein
MSYSINIEHEQRLIRYQHSGILVGNDIGEAWQEFLTLKEFVEDKYDLLSDYRGAKFNSGPNDIDPICAFLGTLEPILRGKRQAIIITDPKSTALTMLFEGKINREIGFEVRIFSTIEAGIAWLVD